MNKKTKVAWLIIGVVLIIGSMVGSFWGRGEININKSSSIWGSVSNYDSYSERVIEGEAMEKVAVIKIKGVISDSSGDPSSYFYAGQGTTAESIVKQLNMAKKDDNVKAVMLEINSPGGSVVAGDTLLTALADFRQSGKKLVAVMRETAASAGYMVALPAEKIFANNGTQTGSIGVIMQLVDLQGLYDKIGVKPIVIKSGKMKDLGSSDRDMTPEEEQVLQGMIDEVYGDFVSSVAKWRNMDDTKVKELADGRIYTGKQAKENGLIDEIGNQNSAINYLKKELDLSEVTLVDYQLGAFGSMLENLIPRFSLSADMQSLIKKHEFNNKLMYLWVL